MENPKQILVADREPEWIRFATEVLEEAGYVIETDDNVQSALQKLTREHFDLAIVDAPMRQLLEQLSTEAEPRRFLVVTTAPSITEAIFAFRLGAVDYVNKVFDPEALSGLVADVLHKQPAQQRVPI